MFLSKYEANLDEIIQLEVFPEVLMLCVVSKRIAKYAQDDMSVK